MTVEQRFQAGFEEAPTDEPGLILDETGTVFVVEPGGSRRSLSDGGTSPIEFKSIQVSAAEILDLHNTAKELLAAPGGRLYHVIFGIVLHYRFVTTGYTLSDAGSLVVGYGTNIAALGISATIAVPSASGGGDFTALDLLQQVADAYAITAGASPSGNNGYADWLATTVEDAPVTLGNVGAAYIDGDSTLTVRIWYSTIDGTPPA